MEFAKNLRNQRQKLGLTAAELASRLGVSRSYISLIENNKRLPGKSLLSRIAYELNLDIDMLVNWYLESIRSGIKGF